MPCVCIGVFGGVVVRPERRWSGHGTGALVDGMVTTQLDDAADDASRRS